MAARVKIRLLRDDNTITTSALLNSGFETYSPDIVVPLEVAKRLGLWPLIQGKIVSLETGGGDIGVPYVEESVVLELYLGDREPKRVRVNVIIDPHVREVTISDYVASALGIILLDFKLGMWRLVDDKPDVRRERGTRGVVKCRMKYSMYLLETL